MNRCVAVKWKSRFSGSTTYQYQYCAAPLERLIRLAHSARWMESPAFTCSPETVPPTSP